MIKLIFREMRLNQYLQVPLPATYTGNGKMLIFTMNDDPAKETPDSWKLMFEAKNIKKDRIEFDVKSFSM